MNYIYDILLNLNQHAYEFFEWELNDNIVHVKKTPLIKIKSEDLINFKNNKVQVTDAFLDIIKFKTNFFGKLNYDYLCLFSDGRIVMGVVFDNDGNNVLKSHLLLDEEMEILDILDIIVYKDIEYQIIEYSDTTLLTRNQLDINNYIKKELYNINEIEKLKYIHYECFNNNECSIHKIKDKLFLELKENWDSIAYRLYDVLKLTSPNK